MVLYRLGRELFLCHKTDNQFQISTVYNGEFGIPTDFYLRVEDLSHNYQDLIDAYGRRIYFIIMTFDGIIMTNVGSIDKVKEAKWMRYEVGPGNLIDYKVTLGQANMWRIHISIHFLYSDQTRVSITYFTDEIVLSNREFMILNGLNNPTLPLVPAYGNNIQQFTFLNCLSSCCYNASLRPDGEIHHLSTWYLPKEGSEVIEAKYGGGVLYSDGTFRYGTGVYDSIIKVQDFNGMLMKSDGSLMNRNSEILAEGITNFHISNSDHAIYAIKEGKLCYTPFGPQLMGRWTILLDDAEGIKFPTGSYYDAANNKTPSMTKSARK